MADEVILTSLASPEVRQRLSQGLVGLITSKQNLLTLLQELQVQRFNDEADALTAIYDDITEFEKGLKEALAGRQEAYAEQQQALANQQNNA